MTTGRRIQMIAFGAALLLVVAWYFLLWSPESKSLKSARKAHSAAVAQVGQLNSQVGSLQGLVKQIPQDDLKFAQLEQALPDNPELDQALNLLHQTAVQTGVTVSNLAPSTPAGAVANGTQASSPQAGGSPAITLGMTAQGTLGQVRNFLAALESMPRTLVVDKLTLSTGAISTANITARIFYAGQPTP